jgi:hypothetical protein
LSLVVRGDIYPPTNLSITFGGACASGTNFFTVGSDEHLRKYTISNTSMQMIASSATLAGFTPSGITFISGTSALIVYSGASTVTIIDTNLMNVTNFTATSQTQRTSNQQVAANTSLGLAMSTTNSTGKITLTSLTSTTNLSPSGLSGGIPQCVISRPDANTWLVGTSLGTIVELSSSGATLSSVSMPSAPFVSAPAIKVQSLAYYNGFVLAVTDSGLLATLNWSTGAIIAQSVGMLSASCVCVLSNSVNSMCLMSNTGSPPQAYKGVTELFFANNNSQPNIDGITFIEANLPVLDVGVEPSGLYAWALVNSSTFIPCRIFNMTSPAAVMVQTDVQNPIGNSVGARIIRLRDCNEVGNACVEVDQAIGPGAIQLPATNNRNYIELCLYGNIVNGNPPYTGWDIREFQS